MSGRTALGRIHLRIWCLPIWLCLTLILFVVSIPVGPRAERPRTVHNSKVGLWDGDPSKELRFVTEFEIGVEFGSDHEMFGNIRDIAINTKGDIFVLDRSYSRVQRYDSTGVYKQTIGRQGEGPGELSDPMALTLDEKDNLYVADRSRINIYDANGNYVERFDHGFPSAFVRTMRIIPDSGIYISCFDVYGQQIIHRYRHDHVLLSSFCDSYAAGKKIDVRIEQTLAGGTFDIDTDGSIYYSQMTPYEIRIFSPLGELESVIYRESDFMHEPRVEVGDSRIRFFPFPASASILVLKNGMFVNFVTIPAVEDSSPEIVIDLFNERGDLLLSRCVSRSFSVKYVDSKGRFFGADYDDFPRVFRARLLVGDKDAGDS